MVSHIIPSISHNCSASTVTYGWLLETQLVFYYFYLAADIVSVFLFFLMLHHSKVGNLSKKLHFLNAVKSISLVYLSSIIQSEQETVTMVILPYFSG